MVLIRVAGNMFPNISDRIFEHFLEEHVCIGPLELLVANGAAVKDSSVRTPRKRANLHIYGRTASTRSKHRMRCVLNQGDACPTLFGEEFHGSNKLGYSVTRVTVIGNRHHTRRSNQLACSNTAFPASVQIQLYAHKARKPEERWQDRKHRLNEPSLTV
jgi:hypothetical protein